MPITSAYVNEINTDWVKVSINLEAIQMGNYPKCKLSDKDAWNCSIRYGEERERRIHNSGELTKLADFACKFYNRTAVLLSQSSGSGTVNFLFACAIE